MSKNALRWMWHLYNSCRSLHGLVYFAENEPQTNTRTWALYKRNWVLHIINELTSKTQPSGGILNSDYLALDRGGNQVLEKRFVWNVSRRKSLICLIFGTEPRGGADGVTSLLGKIIHQEYSMKLVLGVMKKWDKGPPFTTLIVPLEHRPESPALMTPRLIFPIWYYKEKKTSIPVQAMFVFQVIKKQI